MLGYVLGVSDRMRELDRDPQRGVVKRANDVDRAAIAEVLRHECRQAAGERVRLRMRERGHAGKPDCYAVLGEGYSPADAPEALAQVVRQLPDDARASVSYDCDSTTWELRASVWTTTPVAEQAVGEAFEGYVSFQSRDNGTSKFRGGGGVMLLRCLNASTYSADDSAIARVHRGRVLYDVSRMVARSLKAIDTLTAAWGVNRTAAIAVPTVDKQEKRITLEDAIPGFYMYMLRAKQTELAGVLSGRTVEHAANLTRAYFDERRDPAQLTRADLAQGWTRYIQDQPTDIRRDGELAIGDWLVNQREVKCDLGKRGIL